MEDESPIQMISRRACPERTQIREGVEKSEALQIRNTFAGSKFFNPRERYKVKFDIRIILSWHP
jgi:hypothetical protein